MEERCRGREPGKWCDCGSSVKWCSVRILKMEEGGYEPRNTESLEQLEMARERILSQSLQKKCCLGDSLILTQRRLLEISKLQLWNNKWVVKATWSLVICYRSNRKWIHKVLEKVLLGSMLEHSKFKCIVEYVVLKKFGWKFLLLPLLNYW